MGLKVPTHRAAASFIMYLFSISRQVQFLGLRRVENQRDKVSAPQSFHTSVLQIQPESVEQSLRPSKASRKCSLLSFLISCLCLVLVLDFILTTHQFLRGHKEKEPTVSSATPCSTPLSGLGVSQYQRGSQKLSPRSTTQGEKGKGLQGPLSPKFPPKGT